MSSRFVVAAATSLVVLGAGQVAVAQPAASGGLVHGHWYNAGPCVFTGAAPHPDDPTHADLTCDGSSVWTGTWTGVTEFAVTGEGDVVSNDYSGRLSELFIGTAAGRRGSLLFHETFRVASGRIRIVAKIVSGSGGFAGSTGTVVFSGTITPATNGFGTYEGHWSPGAGSSGS